MTTLMMVEALQNVLKVPQQLDQVLKWQQQCFCRCSKARIHITPSKYFLLEKLDPVKHPSSTFSLQLWYCAGSRLQLWKEHLQQFNDIQLENAQSTSMESKTNYATLYNVEVGELKVGIIDTPGFGYSGRLKQDEKHAKRIIEVLKKVEYINCVCLIINGRQVRPSTSLQYVLSEIMAILPRQILQNLIVVFSNISDPLDLNLDPNELTAYFGRPVPQDLIFFIENPYCRFEKAKVAQFGIERVANNLERSFNDTMKVLNEIFLKINDFQ